MTASQDISVEDLVARIVDRGQTNRSITAVCGPPGAGKSTLSDELAARLNETDPGSAAVFPMDGYHYDDLILNARGWRSRKGAPHTFDVGGFRHMLMRLMKGEHISTSEASGAGKGWGRGLQIVRELADRLNTHPPMIYDVHVQSECEMPECHRW